MHSWGVDSTQQVLQSCSPPHWKNHSFICQNFGLIFFHTDTCIKHKSWCHTKETRILEISTDEGWTAAQGFYMKTTWSLCDVSFSCSYDFTPMDSSAVYVLSSMARQRRASLSCGGSNNQDAERSECSSKNCVSTASSHLPSNSLYSKAGKSHSSGTASTVSATSPNKCKRPMNAFMLFAKKYRVEYTQMYPGKDNR